MNAQVTALTNDLTRNVIDIFVGYNPSDEQVRNAVEDIVSMAYAEGMNAVAEAVQRATFDAPSLPLIVAQRGGYADAPYLAGSYLGAD